MRRLPPKKYLKGTVTMLRRYVGRVREAPTWGLVLDLWPANFRKLKTADKGLLYANLSVNGNSGVTAVGKFHCGTPVDLWTWEADGEERLYVRPQRKPWL